MWWIEAAAIVADGEGVRFPRDQLDELIAFVHGRETSGAALLSAEFERRGLALEAARARALVALDDCLFRRPADAWETLGLRRGATPEAVQTRFRRLLRIFHPDRGLGEPRWAEDRTNALYEAHRIIETGGAEPRVLHAVPASASTGGFYQRPKEPGAGDRLRASLGTPETFQRRFFSILILAIILAFAVRYYGGSLEPQVDGETRSGTVGAPTGTGAVGAAIEVTEPATSQLPATAALGGHGRREAPGDDFTMAGAVGERADRVSAAIERRVPDRRKARLAASAPGGSAGRPPGRDELLLRPGTGGVDAPTRPASTRAGSVDPLLRSISGSISGQAPAASLCDRARPLLGRYVQHYLDGDAEALSALYHADAVRNDAKGAADIRARYEDHFAVSRARELVIDSSSRLAVTNDICLIQGDFTDRFIDERGRSQARSGTISLYLTLGDDDRIRIARLSDAGEWRREF